jgi:hypothetical protein
MKPILLSLLLLSGTYLVSNSQTDSIEKKAAFDSFQKGYITNIDFRSLGSKWHKKMQEIKGYPDMPLDQTGQVYFSNQYEYKGVMKIKIFNRTMEWACINFGTEVNKIYSNLTEGKIIFNGSFSLNGGSSTCVQTVVISIKDEKLLIEIFNFKYQSVIPAVFESNEYASSYRSAEFITTSINSIFPIILKGSNDWDSNLDLLKNTKSEVLSRLANLDGYITNYDVIYNF